MKLRRFVGIAGIIIGFAFLVASAFRFWMVFTVEPSLKSIDIGAHPEFGFASIADWKRAALTPVLAFALFGAASIAWGIQAFIRPAIGFRVGMVASVTMVATYVVLVVLRSDLWLEFLLLPGIGVGEFLETWRHRTRATFIS